MAIPFLDTNILLRYFTDDHATHSPAARRLLAALDQGTVKCQISDIVIFETIFTLGKLYSQPKERIRFGINELLALPGIVLSTKRIHRRALDLYVDKGMSFPDAYHAALIESSDMTQIVTFDRDFDGLDGIERLEPDQHLESL